MAIRDNTLIYRNDGKYISIREAYHNNLQKINTICLDTINKTMTYAVIQDIKINSWQETIDGVSYTRYPSKIYHLVLSNGQEIECCDKQKILLPNNTFLQASLIQPTTRVYTLTKVSYAKRIITEGLRKFSISTMGMYKLFDGIIDKRLPLTSRVIREQFDETDPKSYLTDKQLESLVEYYKDFFPYIEQVWSEDITNNERLYDFRVPNYGNVLLPIGLTYSSILNTRLTYVCISSS